MKLVGDGVGGPDGLGVDGMGVGDSVGGVDGLGVGDSVGAPLRVGRGVGAAPNKLP